MKTKVSAALFGFALTLATACFATPQTSLLIESFDSATLIAAPFGSGSSWASGSLALGPFQWSQQDGYIHFEPRNGGDPSYNGDMSKLALAPVWDASAMTTLSFTARRNEGDFGGTLLVSVDYLGGAASYAVDTSAMTFGEWETFTWQLDSFDYISGALNLAQIIGWGIRGTGSRTEPFRMDFADLRLSAPAGAAIPEPPAVGGVGALCALALALVSRRRRLLSTP